MGAGLKRGRNHPRQRLTTVTRIAQQKSDRLSIGKIVQQRLAGVGIAYPKNWTYAITCVTVTIWNPRGCCAHFTLPRQRYQIASFLTTITVPFGNGWLVDAARTSTLVSESSSSGDSLFATAIVARRITDWTIIHSAHAIWLVVIAVFDWFTCHRWPSSIVQ